MNSTITVSKPDKNLIGAVSPETSKSICNRVLMIQALCESPFKIHNISNSKDSETLQRLLKLEDSTLDAGAAGTTYRFMTAFLAARSGEFVLTGSKRMKERPIGILVDALQTIGAKIQYTEKEGFPPLRIVGEKLNKSKEVSIQGDVSSQYISALLMIAPTLPDGLTIHITGEISSRPYLQMTLDLMEHFGVKHTQNEAAGKLSVAIAPQKYIGKDFTVEADWSAASYYYAMAAFSENCDLKIHGLQKDSLQGDSKIAEMMTAFGIETSYHDGYVQLQKNGETKPMFEFDFSDQPDMAQTIAVTCAGLNITGLFTGLHTLRIKETDRIKALQNELAKIQIWLSAMPARFSKSSDKEFFMQEGNSVIELPAFETYDDHRMALAFATLGIIAPVKILDPDVVVKSYPKYWEDLEMLGFEIVRTEENIDV